MRHKVLDKEFEQYIPRHGSYGKLTGEKSERRKIARAYKERGLSYLQIGKIMGITRQRAQQLVAPTLLQAQRIREGLGNECSICGSTDNLNLHHQDYSEQPDTLLCTACHMIEHRIERSAGNAKRQIKIPPAAFERAKTIADPNKRLEFILKLCDDIGAITKGK